MRKENNERTLRLGVLIPDRDGQFEQEWNSTEPEAPPEPVAPGVYRAWAKSGKIHKARTGTVGYRVTFEITEPGPEKGREVPFIAWITSEAAARSRHYLKMLNKTTYQDLDTDLARGILAKIRVTARETSSGRIFNEVEDFEVITDWDDLPRNWGKKAVDPVKVKPRRAAPLDDDETAEKEDDMDAELEAFEAQCAAEGERRGR